MGKDTQTVPPPYLQNEGVVPIRGHILNRHLFGDKKIRRPVLSSRVREKTYFREVKEQERGKLLRASPTEDGHETGGRTSRLLTH